MAQDNRKRRYAIVILAGLSLGLLFAGSVPAAEGQKVGYVDIKKTFDDYEKTKELEKQLDQTKESKQNERNKQLSEIERLRDELELLSEKGKEEKEKVVEAKIKKLREFDQETRTGILQQRDNMVREIFKEIEDAVKEYGEKEGYRLILSERAVYYGVEEDDLTDEIIALLNKKYKKR